MCKMPFYLKNRNSRFSTLEKHTSFKLIRIEIKLTKNHLGCVSFQQSPTVFDLKLSWLYTLFCPPAASPMSALPLTPDTSIIAALI